MKKKTIINKKELAKIIKEENDNWSKIFASELESRKTSIPKKFSSCWWEEYYMEIKSHFFHNFLINKNNPKILENGSGSGKASLLLNKNLDITLLDISKVALDFAKVLSKDYKCKKVKYVEGNIFDMKFKDSTFDMTWNIGVVEHYEEKEIISILREMIRVTKKDGLIAFGVPNKKSGPIIKAKILTYKIFKKIPGYRLGSEKFYTPDELQNFVIKAFEEEGCDFENLELNYFGNPLIMESPKWVIRSFGKVASSIFYKRKFLIMVSVNKL